MPEKFKKTADVKSTVPDETGGLLETKSPSAILRVVLNNKMNKISRKYIPENNYGSLGDTYAFFSQNTLNNFEKYVEGANLTISSFYVKMKKLENKLGYQLESKLSSKENSLSNGTEIEALTKNKKLNNMSEEDITELEKLAAKAKVLLAQIKDPRFKEHFKKYKSEWELPTLVKNLETIAGAHKTNATQAGNFKQQAIRKK